MIGGARDITVPGEHSRALHAAIGRSSYAEIDAGHGMFFEQEEVFVELATGFLSRSA